MSLRSKNEDRLSSLPEDVLSHILSLMPTIYAVRTCVLSKRWRHTWTFVTNLDFNDRHPVYALKCFSAFVDRVLERCKTQQLTIFRLGYCHHVPESKMVIKWINGAVWLNVCEIYINISLAELPISLFTCKTLTKLKLVLSVYDSNVFDISSPVMLPALKTLDLCVFSEHSVNICKIIHGCPVLESLSLWMILRNYYMAQDFRFNIDIPTLKRLELIGSGSLSWSQSFIASFGLQHSYAPLPKFLNLRHLELKHSCVSQWSFLIQIIESYPELENFSFTVPKGIDWCEPQSVPTCMLSKLKTIKITKCKGRKCDLQFLEFMLGNARVLKTLTIICGSLGMEEERELYARLMMFPRSYRFCEIHFVGNWLKGI